MLLLLFASMSVFISLFPALPFLFQPSSADLLPIFSFPAFADPTGSAPDISLLGDAQVIDGGSHVRLTRPTNHSTGRVTYGKPIKLSYGGGDDVNAAPATKVSFSTRFSFSLSPGNGDGLAFFILPAAAAASGRGGGCFGLQGTGSKVVAVVFGTRGSGSGAGIHIGNSSSILESERNASGFSLNSSGQGLDCWIDYQGGSNRIEVWLTKSGNKRPSDPLLSYFPIDLSELWDKDKEVLVGLGSSNGNSTQTCSVYSWNFKIRVVPHWLHSQPYLPDALSKKGDDDEDAGVASHRHRRSNCILRFLGAVIFGTGCGALGAFFALLSWSILGERCRPAAVVPAPQEFSGCCPGEFEYKKIKVVVAEDKAVGNGEKVEP